MEQYLQELDKINQLLVHTDVNVNALMSSGSSLKTSSLREMSGSFYNECTLPQTIFLMKLKNLTSGQRKIVSALLEKYSLKMVSVKRSDNSRFIQIGSFMMTTRMDTNCSSKHQTISLISI